MKKNVLVAFLIFSVGAIAGGSVVYSTQRDKGQSVVLDSSSIQNTQTEQKAPEEALSPQTVATQPQKYLNKKIKVYGVLNKVGDKYYTIASINPNETISLRGDFSGSNINPDDYALSTAKAANNETVVNNPKIIGPVTLVGTLKQIDSGNNVYTMSLFVESVLK